MAGNMRGDRNRNSLKVPHEDQNGGSSGEDADDNKTSNDRVLSRSGSRRGKRASFNAQGTRSEAKVAGGSRRQSTALEKCPLPGNPHSSSSGAHTSGGGHHASIKEPKFVSHVAFRQKQHRAASLFVSIGFVVTVVGVALSAMAYGNPTGAGILGRSSDKVGINPMKIVGPMIIFAGLCIGVGGVAWVSFTINKHKQMLARRASRRMSTRRSNRDHGHGHGGSGKGHEYNRDGSTRTSQKSEDGSKRGGRGWHDVSGAGAAAASTEIGPTTPDPEPLHRKDGPYTPTSPNNTTGRGKKGAVPDPLEAVALAVSKLEDSGPVSPRAPLSKCTSPRNVSPKTPKTSTTGQPHHGGGGGGGSGRSSGRSTAQISPKDNPSLPPTDAQPLLQYDEEPRYSPRTIGTVFEYPPPTQQKQYPPLLGNSEHDI